MEKTKETKRQIGKQLRREIVGLKILKTALTGIQPNMVCAKSIIIKGLKDLRN